MKLFTYRAFVNFATLSGLSTLLMLGSANLAFAGLIGTGINNEQISCMGVNIGTLTMTAPTATTSGVSVSGTFTGGGRIDPNDTIMWVQMIFTNQAINGGTNNAWYFDPAKNDPLNTNYPGGGALQYPFYYNVPAGTAAQNQYLYTNYQPGNSNSNARFSDSPSRPTTGNASWTAELSLVCWDRPANTLEILWTGKYGFTTDANAKTDSVTGITQLGTVNNNVFSAPAPVAFNQAALDAAGFHNNNAIPANNWTISTTCDCFTVPEPSSLFSSACGAILLLGFAQAQKIRSRSDHANGKFAV